MVGDVCRYRRDRSSVLEHASDPGARDHGTRHSRARIAAGSNASSGDAGSKHGPGHTNDPDRLRRAR